jgi:hypothetical protein
MTCFGLLLQDELFSRGSNDIGNKGRGNWQRGHIRPRFSIHFDDDPHEFNHIFQDGLFNLVGQEILQPQPERMPFQVHHKFFGIQVPPHVSMRPEMPTNSWQEIVHEPVVHHHGWPTASFPLPPPPPKNQISQGDPALSLVQSSHASKTLKIDVPELV